MEHGNTEIVKLLLEGGAVVDAENQLLIGAGARAGDIWPVFGGVTSPPRRMPDQSDFKYSIKSAFSGSVSPRWEKLS
jgi:hypothetical protein